MKKILKVLGAALILGMLATAVVTVSHIFFELIDLFFGSTSTLLMQTVAVVVILIVMAMIIMEENDEETKS